MSFTISLPTHSNFQYTYDRKKFLEMFPDSMISLALQDLEETRFDIHQIVTPYTLEYIHILLTESKLCPSRDNLAEASRYLLIPILEVVCHPEYEKFYRDYLKVNLLDTESIKTHYQEIVVYGLLHQYSSLLSYIWDRLDYKTMNCHIALYVAAYMNNVPVTKMLNEIVWHNQSGEISLIDYVDFCAITGYTNREMEEYLSSWPRLEVSEVCALGQANDTLRLAVVEEGRDRSLVISTINKNVAGIRLAGGHGDEYMFYEALHHAEKDRNVIGAILNIDDISPENIYRVAWRLLIPDLITRFVSDVDHDLALDLIMAHHPLARSQIKYLIEGMDQVLIDKFLARADQDPLYKQMAQTIREYRVKLSDWVKET